MKLLDRIRAHEAVQSVSDETYMEHGERVGVFFVYLKPGWEWSEQTAFGCETLPEAWSLVKETKRTAT